MFGGIFDEIIKKIEEWISGKGHGGDDAGERDLLPVLLVPGIGGSILNAVDDDNSDNAERVWVRLFFADHEFKKKLWSRYDPATGKTLSLDPKSHIEVPDENYGLFSCDILDPAVFIRLNIVYNFHDLIEQLEQWGYKAGTTLFGYGYDFRQSNRLPEAVDGLLRRLEAIHKTSGGKKVNIISHSMGGLLVRSLLALHSASFEKLVNSWTTIATPFQGAPAFVTDCLLTGVEFLKGWQKELWVAKWSTHQLLVECPSVYEMMASLTHEWERPPQLQVWRRHRKHDNNPRHVKLHSYGPLECVSVMEAALKENTLSYDDKTIPIPFNRCILEWANESRRLWFSAKLPKDFKFYNIYGTSCKTPFDVCYGSEKCPIVELKEILHTEADFKYVDGDGTVPSESSKADGFTATARHGVPGNHRGLLRSNAVFLLLKDILEIKDKEKKVAVHAAPHKSEEAIEKQAQFCLSDTAMSHKNSNWDANSEDSQDYNSGSESEDNTENSVVFTINTEDARAQAHARATPHEPHKGFEFHHLSVSAAGVAEGSDREKAAIAVEKAMASATAKLMALYNM
ncbi:phospholipase A(1) LCAT3 [Selaginella moellendorffii]|nr:phospholipase A(1) LCAT3 [Selaginella moellendorffii]|eukprot:XP_002983393.2 phospholipase A(1) LCAT3 [Selaginella moellendorffii]